MEMLIYIMVTNVVVLKTSGKVIHVTTICIISLYIRVYEISSHNLLYRYISIFYNVLIDKPDIVTVTLPSINSGVSCDVYQVGFNKSMFVSLLYV